MGGASDWQPQRDQRIWREGIASFLVGANDEIRRCEDKRIRCTSRKRDDPVVGATSDAAWIMPRMVLVLLDQSAAAGRDLHGHVFDEVLATVREHNAKNDGRIGRSPVPNRNCHALRVFAREYNTDRRSLQLRIISPEHSDEQDRRKKLWTHAPIVGSLLIPRRGCTFQTSAVSLSFKLTHYLVAQALGLL